MSALPINPARLEKLKALGLTEYQARAYLALLDLGIAPAKDVASLSRVPKSKIYSTLDQLHDKGLLAVIPEHPKRYRVLNIELYLKELVSDYHTRLKFIHEREQDLLKEFNPRGDVALEERGAFSVLKGRRNLESKVAEMLAHAKARFLILGTESTPRRLAHLTEPVRDASQRGVQITLVAPFTPDNRDALARLEPHVAHLRPRDPAAPGAGLGVSLFLADGEQALLAHYIPDDSHFYQGDDVAVWTDDHSLAATLDALVATQAPAPAGQAAPPEPFALPADLRRALEERGREPATFLRVAGETLAALQGSTATPGPDEVRAAGHAAGAALTVHLRARESDPARILESAARLYRECGLGEVLVTQGPTGPQVRLEPGPKGPARAPWHALHTGILQGVLQASRGAPAGPAPPEGATAQGEVRKV